MAFNSTEYDWKALNSLPKLFVERLENVHVAMFNNPDTGNCAFLLTQSGKVFSKGKSSVGCLGLGEVTETVEFVELKELSGVAGVCVCGRFGDALAYTREGKVYVWGQNSKPCNTPQLVPELTDIVDARCNAGHYLALTKSGKLYEWRGVTTWNRILNALSQTAKEVAMIEEIMSIACGPFHSLALTKDGQVYSWGKKYINKLLEQQPMTRISLPGETVAKVACGLYQSLVLTHRGEIYTWGLNNCGLGDPSGSIESATPVEVGQNIGRFVDIATNGLSANAAVSNTGAIYMWGYGENGASAKTATVTQCKEMHQVFAKLRYSQCSWTYKTKSSPSCNTVVVEDSSSIVGKLKASFNDEETSDLTVLVDNKPIFVHKYLLRIRSDYFRTLLEERWTYRNKRELVLKSYSYDVFMAYFGFLYSGELTVSPDHLLELWSVCDAYGEDSLKVAVEKLVKKFLPVKTMALMYSKALAKKEYQIKPEEEDLQGALDRLGKDFKELEEIQKDLNKNRLKIQDQLHKIEEDVRSKIELQLQQDVGLQEQMRTLMLQVQKYFNGKHDQAGIVQPEKLLQLDEEEQQEQCQREIEIQPVEDMEALKKELAKLKEDNGKLQEELKEDNAKLKEELKNLKALLLPQEEVQLL